MRSRSRLDRLVRCRQHSLLPDQPEWYRAWRHDELARNDRMSRDARFRRREKAKQIVGEALLVAATVIIFWSLLGS